MRPICSVEVVRRAEAGAGVPEPVLMARASTALAGVCLDLLRGGRTGVRGARVVALVGAGNNGGDALWALAHLSGRGVACVAIGDPPRMHADGAAAAIAAGARMIAWQDPDVAAAIARADLVVDGILGIGGSGAVREPAAGAVRAVRGSGVPVVAVDLPSGVEADTGQVLGLAVRADVTVCFGVLKPALVVPPARSRAGSVTVVDIGLRASDLEPAAWALSLADLIVADPAADAHKYSRGVVGITAGSPTYPGAALLAVGGARMSGAGMVAFSPSGGVPAEAEPGARRGRAHVQLDGPDPVAAMVVAQYPDVVLATDRALDARCIGPGLGQERAARDSVLRAMADPAPLVIDASALAVLARQDGRRALAERSAAGWVSVLTPHAGEFARMGFDPSGGPLVAAQRAALETGAVIVAKGPGTVVAGTGVTYVDTFGDSSLATAGTGDVLAGLIAGMLAAAGRSAGAAGLAGAAGAGGVDAAGAALVAARAVGLHGLAGRLAAAAGGPVTAVEVLGALRAAHAAAASART
jgi:ADP-dependent NAD(P)H-hydrate dehydratase / NAD(P)H-hydrate epimerase